jgi:hypothetical protein
VPSPKSSVATWPPSVGGCPFRMSNFSQPLPRSLIRPALESGRFLFHQFQVSGHQSPVGQTTPHGHVQTLRLSGLTPRLHRPTPRLVDPTFRLHGLHLRLHEAAPRPPGPTPQLCAPTSRLRASTLRPSASTLRLDQATPRLHAPAPRLAALTLQKSLIIQAENLTRQPIHHHPQPRDT